MGVPGKVLLLVAAFICINLADGDYYSDVSYEDGKTFYDSADNWYGDEFFGIEDVNDSNEGSGTDQLDSQESQEGSGLSEESQEHNYLLNGIDESIILQVLAAGGNALDDIGLPANRYDIYD